MQVVTSQDRPDLAAEAGVALSAGWPAFVFHDAVAGTYAGPAESLFPRYRVLVLDDGRVIAGGWGVPFAWDETVAGLPEGYDGALVRAVEGARAGTEPNTFSLMAASVTSGQAGRRLSTVVLGELARRAREDGLAHAVAPLRPTTKHLHPQVPMADFATWVEPDGLSVDPWVRTHQRLGAQLLGPAARSMVVTGTVSDWEAWTGCSFPVTGDYAVPGALNLVSVDREADVGRYEEENLWVRHP